MVPQQYCLRWKHHHSNVQSMFAQLLENERFCDVTLYCSPNFATQVPNKDTVDPANIRGVSLRAHRVVLAACSELLGALLGAHEAQGEPVLVIDGAEPRHLRALLDYMYTGEMNVHHSQLASLLKTAEELRIKGLTDIRWNNKDEPPDCSSGAITTTTNEKKHADHTHHTHHRPEPRITDKITEYRGLLERHAQEKHAHEKHTHEKHAHEKHAHEKHAHEKHAHEKHAHEKHSHEKHVHEKHAHERNALETSAPPTDVLLDVVKKERDESDAEICREKVNVNGGPPPLIKLATKEKLNPLKREPSDTDSPSPKRQRLSSAVEHSEDDSTNVMKSDKELEWRHGNLDITAERVMAWNQSVREGSRSVEGEGDRDEPPSEDEWADQPADIGSFLHTRLRVDGDNSADEESDESLMTGVASRPPSASMIDLKTGKSGQTDPRFHDVVKLNDYLQHGRRPQFWEENYVKRVMEAVRLKELEMKQAAEILGVSYGTLYGRYRDVFGCINRPYRTARDFWQAKGPSEILDRLQRGELSLEAASLALGVNPSNLASYIADLNEKDTEQSLADTDPANKGNRQRTYSGGGGTKRRSLTSSTEKLPGKKTADEEAPTNLAPQDRAVLPQPASSGKWPSIRVASLDSLRGGEAVAPPTTSPSPSQLMRTRPDLTIVAARRERHDDT